MATPAIFSFRKRFPDDEELPPPIPQGGDGDPSPYFANPQDDAIQADPQPGQMPMPQMPDPAQSSVDAQIGNPPPSLPSNDPEATKELKKLGTITPNGVNAMAPPPPPMKSEAEEEPDSQWQGAPPPLPPLNQSQSVDQSRTMLPPTPPSAPSRSEAAFRNIQALGPPPVATKPSLWQRLGAAALAGASAYASRKDFKAAPIDTTQAVENILHPGYAQKLAAYNQQMQAAQNELKTADTYEDLQSRQLQRASLAKQEEAKAQQLAQDAATRAEVAKAKPGLLKQQEKQRQFEKLTRGRDLQALPAGAPIPAGWDKFEDPEDPSIVYVSPANLRKITPELVPYAPGFKDGDTVDRKTYERAADAFNKAQAVENKPAKELNKDDRAIAIMGKPKAQWTPEEASFMQGYDNYVKKNKVDPGVLRMDVLNESKNVPIVDPNDPTHQRVIYVSPQDARGQSAPSSIDFQTNKNLQKDFTSGKDATTLNNINTAYEHTAQLRNAIAALHHNDMQALNKVTDWWKTQTGQPGPANFQMVKTALSGEAGKAFNGGALTVDEKKSIDAAIQNAGSPAQLYGPADMITKLMESKRHQLQNQYEAGRQGKPNFGGSTAPAGGKTIDLSRFER